MLELRNERGRHVRVWFDDLPDASFPASNTVERILTPAVHELVTPRSVMVEIAHHIGGVIRYSLLGATFTPDITVLSLVVRISVVPWGQNGKPFKTPLGYCQGATIVGLPVDWAPMILETTCSVHSLTDLGPGLLWFNQAVYGQVGSHGGAFSETAKIVADLISQPDFPPSEETVRVVAGL